MDIYEALAAALLIGLGTARLTALIVKDKISEGLRDLVFHYFPPEDNDELGHYYSLVRPATDEELRRQSAWDVPWWTRRFATIKEGEDVREATFIGKMLVCQRCTSVWVAGANTALYAAFTSAALGINLLLAAAFVSAAVTDRYYQ